MPALHNADIGNRHTETNLGNREGARKNREVKGDERKRVQQIYSRLEIILGCHLTTWLDQISN